MSETVSVIINGKEYVSKEAEKAGAAIDKLGNTAKKTSKDQGVTLGELKAAWLLYYAAIKKAVDEVCKVLVEMNNEYAEQETNFLKMEAASRSNPLLSGDFAQSMRDWAESNQYAIGVTHDQIEQQAALAGAMGRTETQIHAMVVAAQNLAAAGHGSFEANMEALSRTFEGTASTLARALPGIKQFTKEQLEAGAAVDYVNQKMAGMADAAMKGLTGSRKFAEISKKELEEAAGTFTAPIEIYFNRGFAKIGQQLTEQLNQGLNKTDTNAWFRNFLMDFIKIVDTIGATFEVMFAAVTLPFKLAILGIAKIAMDLIDKSKSAAIQAQMDAAIKNVSQSPSVFRIAYEQIAFDLVKKGSGIDDLKKEMYKYIAKDAEHKQQIIEGFSKGMAALDLLPRATEAAVETGAIAGTLTGAKQGTEYSIDAIVEAMTEVEYAVYRSATDYITAMELMKNPPGNSTENKTEEDEDKDKTKETSEIGNQIAGLFGPVIENLAKGNWVGAIMAVIGQLQALAPILGFVSRLLAEVDKWLEPLVTILQPIFGFITLIGQVLGRVLAPVLEILAPIIQIVAWALLFLYNYAIMPITNAIIFVVKLIQTIIAVVFNAIAAVINVFIWLFGGTQIPYLSLPDFTTGYLAPISMDEMNALGKDATTQSDTTSVYGGNVTQMKQPDIYIHQYFQAPVIGEGGMRQVGQFVIDAIQEEINYGGRPQFLEAGA